MRGSETDLPRVLIIGPIPPPAFGVAKATQLMLESPILTEAVTLFHLGTSDDRGVANIGKLDLRNVVLGIRHVWRLIVLLARERPDITLLTASQGKFGLTRDVLFVWCARLFRSRAVTYLRGSRYAHTRANEGWFAARALRSMLKNSSRVIVLGHTLVDMGRAVYPEAQIAVVPNGCPPAVPPESVGSRDPDHPVVAYIGRLSESKGIGEALLAAARVMVSVPSLEFVLHGDWDTPAFRDKTMRSVADLGLDGVVRFPGPTTGDQKQTLLARAWALVVPSRSEGHPWVILEAMSAGLPVIATDTGAVAETVVDGETGFVVPIADAEALAQRITMVLQDDALWERMSRSSVHEYEARFTMASSHAALAEVLRRVWAGEKEPRPSNEATQART